MVKNITGAITILIILMNISLINFAVVVVLFAVIGAAAEAERRGEIGPHRDRAAVRSN